MFQSALLLVPVATYSFLLVVGADDLLHGEVGYGDAVFIAGEPCCFDFEKQLLVANKLCYPAEVIGGEGECHIMD